MKYVKIIAALFLVMAMSILCALPALGADGGYDYSEEYKGSKYYSALTAYAPTGDARKDIAGIAATQIGYHEGDGNADMDGENTAGSRNFVEYNRLYGKLDNNEGNGVSYGYEWCCAFVSWCLAHAGLAPNAFIVEVSCPRMAEYLGEGGRFFQAETGFLPEAGDLIFFGESSFDPKHVGIVERVEDNKVYTIEGNKNNCVGRFSYELKDAQIYGYGRIVIEPGEFFVTRRTDLYADDGKYLDAIPAGSTVEVVAIDGNRAQMIHNGVSAWAAMTFLFPADSLSFCVYYELEGGKSGPDEQYRKPGEELTLSTKRPTMKGNVFLGWATSEGGEVVYQPGDKYSRDESVVLYAVWQANKHTVRFQNPDGSIISETVYNYCDVIVVPESPSMASDGQNKFVFEKWDEAVQKFCFADATYTAVYTSIPLTDAEKAALSGEGTDSTEGGCSSLAAPCVLVAAVCATALKKRKK